MPAPSISYKSFVYARVIKHEAKCTLLIVQHLLLFCLLL